MENIVLWNWVFAHSVWSGKKLKIEHSSKDVVMYPTLQEYYGVYQTGNNRLIKRCLQACQLKKQNYSQKYFSSMNENNIKQGWKLFLLILWLHASTFDSYAKVCTNWSI